MERRVAVRVSASGDEEALAEVEVGLERYLCASSRAMTLPMGLRVSRKMLRQVLKRAQAAAGVMQGHERSMIVRWLGVGVQSVPRRRGVRSFFLWGLEGVVVVVV